MVLRWARKSRGLAIAGFPINLILRLWIATKVTRESLYFQNYINILFFMEPPYNRIIMVVDSWSSSNVSYMLGTRRIWKFRKKFHVWFYCNNVFTTSNALKCYYFAYCRKSATVEGARQWWTLSLYNGNDRCRLSGKPSFML